MKSSGGRAQGTYSVYNTSGEGQLARGCFFNALFLPLFPWRSDVEYTEDHCHLVSPGLLVLPLNRMPSAPQRVSLGNAASALSSL